MNRETTYSESVTANRAAIVTHHSSGQRELDHSPRDRLDDEGAHCRPNRGARGVASRRGSRGRATPGGDRDREPHASGAVAWDVADEVARAGRRERDVGRSAAVVAQRAASGAGEVVGLAHLRHRVLLSRVVEHCDYLPRRANNPAVCSSCSAGDALNHA